MKRRLARFGLMLLLLAVAAISFAWYTSPNRRINRATFEKIQEGMSLAEVEAAIGCPPRNYAYSGTWATRFGDDDVSVNVVVLKMAVDESNAENGFSSAIWASNSGVIRVHFDKGKVWSQEFYDVRLEVKEMLSNWFGIH